MKSMNTRIVEMFVRKRKMLQQFRTKLKHISKCMDILAKKESDYLELSNYLDNTSCVYKGVAIHKWGQKPNIYFSRIDHASNLRAKIYLNAHNNTTYGLTLHCDKWIIDKWCGASFKSYSQVIKYAKEWVAIGHLKIGDKVYDFQSY